MKTVIHTIVSVLATAIWSGVAGAQPTAETKTSEELTETVQTSVDRALEWLATQQDGNGSFKADPTYNDVAQPAVTGLTVLAFLANGHSPSVGRYGKPLDRAVEFILASQKPPGYFSVGNPFSNSGTFTASQTANYNHAIAGLVLCELYGMLPDDKAESVKQAIERALLVTWTEQDKRKNDPLHQGGWRYANDSVFSDLSVTSWQLMFARSAKNAGFAVSQVRIQRAVDFVKRCYDPRVGTFRYSFYRGSHQRTRAMAGAGIVAISQSGVHDSDMAKSADRWLLQNSFAAYNSRLDPEFTEDRFHYGVFYASMGMYQLGKDYWDQFYPPLAKTLVRNQRRGGAWSPENHPYEFKLGSCYTTAIVVIALSLENQLLPILQKSQGVFTV
jgi:hypothetical protein